MSETESLNLLLLAAAWLAYGLLHSLLASLRVKAWAARVAPALFPAYRLMYNGIAMLTALPILWLLLHADGPYLLYWSGPWRWLAYGLMLAACGGFVVSLFAYDLIEFAGLRQLRSPTVRSQTETRSLVDQGEFRIAFFHRFVRHPWYFFSLIVLWTQNMNAAILLSAVAISLYLVIGTRLEERKLLTAHGEAYRRYMARVPGLIPLPWKFLTAREAADLLRKEPPR